MKLHELLKNIKPLQVAGDSEVEITGVNIDSRRIAKGHLFVAMRGTQVDGHKFIGKAIDQGAVAVLCEEMPDQLCEGVTYIQVDSTEDAVGRVATVFYGEPSKKLKLVGVTGTNGKTTIATLLYNMFRKMGHRCGLHSTVCNYIEDEAIAADHTTPDPIELNAQQRKNVLAITDRKEAIRTACMMAEKGDVILVAGKGHENYQEIKGVKHHFDDKEVLRDIFNNQ